MQILCATMLYLHTLRIEFHSVGKYLQKILISVELTTLYFDSDHSYALFLTFTSYVSPNRRKDAIAYPLTHVSINSACFSILTRSKLKSDTIMAISFEINLVLFYCKCEIRKRISKR